MKVILKADIKGVGKKDEVINASDGYARNFLFPKNLAVEANAENMSKLKAQKDSNQFKKDTEKEEAKKLAEKLTKIMTRIEVKAGENGKIFGGVSAKEIAEAIQSFFPSTSIDQLTTSVQSYKDIDAWNDTPVLKQEAFDRLQEVMTMAGELKNTVPYDKIVNNTYANNAIKSK